HHSCLLLLLLFLCLLLPPGALGPLPPPEEPWQPLPPPSGTADPTAHLLHGHPSAPVQPYSHSLSPENYCYSPKPWHLQPRWLDRLLGSGFDPFWMVTEEPQVRNGSVLEENLESLSRDLAEGAGRYCCKLWPEAEGLELPNLLPPDLGVAQAARHLTWVDLGPIFWPHWGHHTACETSLPSCSWPSGMACCPAQITQIKLLAWHCWIPYPVVAACKCSCH
uniref:Noggin n=1 Tax=Bubo bubo TaxID=30461 RepID=A0A8C0EKR4_BUBBB